MGKLKVQELKIAQDGRMILPSGQDQITGTSMIFTGQEFGLVVNNKVSANSKIFVSFTSNLAGASWWICDKIIGQSFKICLSQPAQELLEFDYWIIQASEIQDEEEDNVEGDVVTGETTEEPPTEEPSVEAFPIEEPPVEEPLVEEPLTEEPPTEEPPVEEPVIEESAVEEPLTEEPPTEEPPADESLIEELPAEEPPADGSALEPEKEQSSL